jgi:hypothetical protein
VTRRPIGSWFVVRLSIVLCVAWAASSYTGRAAEQPSRPTPGRIEVLKSIGGLPPETCNVFRDPVALQQTASGSYYVFDRRDHAVYSVPSGGTTPVKIVDIGGEGGRLLEPTAFDMTDDGRFAVADAPRGQERLQVFDPLGNGSRAFFCPVAHRRGSASAASRSAA